MMKDEENVPGTTMQLHQPPPTPTAPSRASPAYPPPGHLYYPYAYQSVPGYAVVEGRTVRERHLPCCGIGCGWFLFIIGFFLIAIPWYVGLLIPMCGRSVDYREKPGWMDPLHYRCNPWNHCHKSLKQP